MFFSLEASINIKYFVVLGLGEFFNLNESKGN